VITNEAEENPNKKLQEVQSQNPSPSDDKGIKNGFAKPCPLSKKKPKISGNVFNDDKPYHMAENIKQAKGNE